MLTRYTCMNVLQFVLHLPQKLPSTDKQVIISI